MRNEDKINELQALGKTPDMEDVFDTLEKIGDLKVNYDEILRDATDKWKVGGPSIFDIAISEYLDTGNYNEVAAVLTFLTREDKVACGAFERRSKNGEIKKVIDRMIQLLQSDESAAAQEWITVKGQICPVCGKYTFIEDDNFEICPVCGWEDDGIQRDDPDYAGGANHLSLNQYREEYKRRMENHCGNREGAMIQLKKMVKDPPTDVRAYYDIAETSGAFEESYKYFKDKEFSDFVMETLREDFKDPEIVDIIKGELKRSEEELKHSKQMRDLLKEYEAHEEEIGFDLNAVKRTLDPAVIHTAVLRVMTEQGVPGWAKRFYIKGKLMELVKMYCR